MTFTVRAGRVACFSLSMSHTRGQCTSCGTHARARTHGLNFIYTKGLQGNDHGHLGAVASGDMHLCSTCALQQLFLGVCQLRSGNAHVF